MPGPVEIFRLNYAKADLDHVQEDDVVFFFMMCQLHNDIAALLRIVFANWPDPASVEPVAANRATTCFLAIRTLAGRLEEGWKSIKDLFGLSLRNYPLNQKSQASYQTLRAYFGTSNFIRLLRDNAANHHQREPMREAWRLLPNDHEFTDFTAKGLGNTVYWAAENVMTANAILLAQKFQPDLDGRDALEWMIKEVSSMTPALLHQLHCFFRAMVQSNGSWRRPLPRPPSSSGLTRGSSVQRARRRRPGRRSRVILHP